MDFGTKDYILKYFDGEEPEFSEMFYTQATAIAGSMVANRSFQNQNVKLIFIQFFIITLDTANATNYQFTDFLNRNIFFIAAGATINGISPFTYIYESNVMQISANGIGNLNFSVGYQWVRKKEDKK